MKVFSIIILCVLLIIPGRAVGGNEQDGDGELVDLSATAAVLIEPGSGRVLYQHNAHQPLPMASTTKIMTALVAAELSQPENVFEVQADCVKIEGASLYLEENEQLTMMDMLYGLLLRSGNDASMAIAKEVAGDVGHFVSLMNSKAWVLGMKNTNFVNPHGLHHDDHVSTAYDLGILGATFMRQPLLPDICATDEYISRELTSGRVRLFINNNKLLTRDPRALGIKIGWTEQAGRCLVAAAKQGDLELVAVVLNAPDLYGDVSKLFDYGFDQFQLKELISQGQVLSLVPGETAAVSRVALTAGQAVRFPVLPGESVSYSMDMSSVAALSGPLAPGQVPGKATVIVDGHQYELDLIATTVTYSRPHWWTRIWNWIRG